MWRAYLYTATAENEELSKHAETRHNASIMFKNEEFKTAAIPTTDDTL